jgi:phenylacetate-coenzyme A ligase PaaK-like adenylate-forming protein
VLVEIPDPGVNVNGVLAAVAKELADAHEGLRFGVQHVDVGTLPRFELKAKRVLDERIVIGTEGEARGQA